MPEDPYKTKRSPWECFWTLRVSSGCDNKLDAERLDCIPTQEREERAMLLVQWPVPFWMDEKSSGKSGYSKANSSTNLIQRQTEVLLYCESYVCQFRTRAIQRIPLF